MSLNDTKTAVNKLHHMLNAAVGILLFVIWLLILKIASTHIFVLVGSQMLLVAFMFGNTCKTTFEAIIFLFVMHPFDVGDRCEVDGVQVITSSFLCVFLFYTYVMLLLGMLAFKHVFVWIFANVNSCCLSQMVVEEMNILTTVFLRYDNQKITYPNSILATKPIGNFYRSPDMGDSVDFCIHIATPVEKIALMKERITRYGHAPSFSCNFFSLLIVGIIYLVELFTIR